MSTCSLSSLHRDELGSLTMVNTGAVLACTLMTVFLLNVGSVVDQKIEMQNAADAAAVSGATIMARGMNAVTATNHVIGEMIGMVIVHHGYGGHNLDNNETGDTEDEDKALDAARNAYRGAGGSLDTAYNTVREESGVKASDGSAELESKKLLKERLTQVYVVKTIAEGMKRSSFPPTVAAGEAMHFAAHIVEMIILAEYEGLDALHQAARALTPMKLLLRDAMAPAAKLYTEEVVRETPRLSLETAEAVASLGGCEGTLYPLPPPLPLVIDPHAQSNSLVRPSDQPVEEACSSCKSCGSDKTDVTRDQIVKITQLARASFPWVTYHRKPLLDFMGPLFPLSQCKKHYKDATDGASKHVCDEVQTGSQDLGLYVLADYPSPDKGYAAWTEDADKADARFSIVGLAYRDAPGVYGGGVFRQQHTAGRIAYAQALIYNANPQERAKHRIDLRCKRITPNDQARVGWDTLNWDPEAPPVPELIAKTDRGGAPSTRFPAVKLNWQAKLVPGSDSRVSEMVARRQTLPSQHAGVVGKMTPRLAPTHQTH